MGPAEGRPRGEPAEWRDSSGQVYWTQAQQRRAWVGDEVGGEQRGRRGSLAAGGRPRRGEATRRHPGPSCTQEGTESLQVSSWGPRRSALQPGRGARDLPVREGQRTPAGAASQAQWSGRPPGCCAGRGVLLPLPATDSCSLLLPSRFLLPIGSCLQEQALAWTPGGQPSGGREAAWPRATGGIRLRCLCVT